MITKTRVLVWMCALWAQMAWAFPPSVAVLNFNNAGSGSSFLTTEIPRSLSQSLMRNPQVRVVDRALIDQVIRERRLLSGSTITDAQALQIAQLVQANYVIVGAFVDTSAGAVRIDARLLRVDGSLLTPSGTVFVIANTPGQLSAPMDNLASRLPLNGIGNGAPSYPPPYTPPPPSPPPYIPPPPVGGPVVVLPPPPDMNQYPAQIQLIWDAYNPSFSVMLDNQPLRDPLRVVDVSSGQHLIRVSSRRDAGYGRPPYFQPLFERVIQASGGYLTRIRMGYQQLQVIDRIPLNNQWPRAPMPPPAYPQNYPNYPAPPPAYPAPAPRADSYGLPLMDPNQFAGFLSQVEQARFSDARQQVIRMAAQRNAFTCAQAGQVVDIMDFSADKMEALRMLARRIVDRNNHYTLLSHFTYQSDKDEARQILEHADRRNP